MQKIQRYMLKLCTDYVLGQNSKSKCCQKKKKLQQVGITAPETKHTPECITNRIRKLTAITFHILM